MQTNYYAATTYHRVVMFDWYWTVVEEAFVVVGTEEAVEVGALPALNLEMVVVHVAHSAAAGGWGSFLLAVGDMFLVKIVAGLVGTEEIAFAEVLACSHVACHTLVALAVVVVSKL